MRSKQNDAGNFGKIERRDEQFEENSAFSSTKVSSIINLNSPRNHKKLRINATGLKVIWTMNRYTFTYSQKMDMINATMYIELLTDCLFYYSQKQTRRDNTEGCSDFDQRCQSVEL
jgi:hypothetical protein